mmetsp:Transcript_82666/g.234187  ORF Transcript_82666/g.234187 Transcript_82666/m.234187 type:complete len:215 (-) Transcript_82666:624-1268(-)
MSSACFRAMRRTARRCSGPASYHPVSSAQPASAASQCTMPRSWMRSSSAWEKTSVRNQFSQKVSGQPRGYREPSSPRCPASNAGTKLSIASSAASSASMSVSNILAVPRNIILGNWSSSNTRATQPRAERCQRPRASGEARKRSCTVWKRARISSSSAGSHASIQKCVWVWLLLAPRRGAEGAKLRSGSSASNQKPRMRAMSLRSSGVCSTFRQ